MNRRLLERWSALFGGCALAGAYYHYYLLSVALPRPRAALETILRTTAAGHMDAPYQYRFLVPSVLVWVSDHTFLSLVTATALVDGVALAVGATLGVALLRRSGLGLFALPALVYCSFLMFGPVLHYKPETFTAFACTTAALLALERRPSPEGWWSSVAVWTALIVAAALLVGCRTDVLMALGIGFAVRWWQRRDPADLAAAGLLLMTALVGTVALIRAYPDAHYPPGVGIIQVSYNFDALTFCVLGAFIATAVGPLIALRGPVPLAVSVRDVASARLPVLAVIASVVAASFVVGRIDEVRLIFPVAFALAWVGADLWHALLSSVEIEERPRTMTLE